MNYLFYFPDYILTNHHLHARTKKDMTLLLGIVEFMSLEPVVANRACGNRAILMIEAARRNRLCHLLRYCHLGARIFVPITEGAIRANGSQRSMFWMNLDVIHSVNVQLCLSTVRNSTMASERVVFL